MSDFDPRFYESLGTLGPQCSSRFGGTTTGSDHDHQCEYDADADDPQGRCAEYARVPGQGYVRMARRHECACGQASWSSGQSSVLLSGEMVWA